jgi:hypothetical protein
MGRDLGNEALTPFGPAQATPDTPLDHYTRPHANILVMMAESGKPSEDEEPGLHSQPIDDDHAVAATLPIDHSAVDEHGHMDHHRKPIISIHGKDVDERELEHKHAA